METISKKIEKWHIDISKVVNATFLACLFFFSIRYGYGIIEGPKCLPVIALFAAYYIFHISEKLSLFDGAFFILFTSYYLLGNYQHTFLEGSSGTYDILPYTWTVPLIYLLGKAVAGYSKQNLDKRCFVILATMAAGMFVQGLLNYAGFFLYDYQEVYRSYMSPNGLWFTYVNGPGTWRAFWSAATDGNRNKWNNGFLIVLGALFFSLLVRKTYKLFTNITILAIVTAVCISFYFKGRAVIVLLAFTFAVMAVLYCAAEARYWDRKAKRKIGQILLAFAGFGILGFGMFQMNLFGLADKYNNSYFIHRDGGILNNVRVQMWLNGLKRAFTLQKGGWDLSDVTVLPTAHNAWIEFARYYDVVIFLLIVIFLVLTLVSCVRLVVKHGHEYPVVYFAVSTVLIMFFYCMIEPVYIENQDLLLFFYFACGIVSGINYAAEQGDYTFLGETISINKKRYIAVGLGLLSFAFITILYMDWWNDRMQLLWPVVIPTVAYVAGGFSFRQPIRKTIIISSAAISGAMAIYMYAISVKSEFYEFGIFTEPFTRNNVDKSVYIALWILPLSVAVGIILYLLKLSKPISAIATIAVTGIGAYPAITDGRMLFIKEALKLQLGMKSGLQWIASKENYLGIRTSHSIWLDYARDYGMVVFGLLIVFELWSIFCFVRMLRNGRKSFVDYVLIVAFVLFNFFFMFEASAITSKYLLAMGLLVYGMITSSVATLVPDPITKILQNAYSFWG